MCNEIVRLIAIGQVRDDFHELRIPLRFPEGVPNLGEAPSIRITDTTLIVRGVAGREPEAVQRRWSWPGRGGRPVYNYRSEDREFRNSDGAGRCLIPADAFFEFTDPEAGARRKTRWRFSHARDGWLAIAGLWRSDAAVGEAFTMLTCAPGPDVAPYHGRQVVVLPREHWAAWLGGEVPAGRLLLPAPAGTLGVVRA